MRHLFFTADLHFGHSNIIPHCNRPFASTEEMDESIIATINNVVGARDTLYVVGDFCWKERDVPAYFGALDCLTKYLVVGNHDFPSTARKYFDKVTDIEYLRHNSQKLVLCHYPFQSWRRGWFHLHGHTHGTLPSRPGRFDIGWDCWGRPLEFDEVISLFQSHPPMEMY